MDSPYEIRLVVHSHADGYQAVWQRILHILRGLSRKRGLSPFSAMLENPPSFKTRDLQRHEVIMWPFCGYNEAIGKLSWRRVVIR